MNSSIALFYGGLSAEHEVSVISAKFIFEQLELSGYKVIPVYVHRDGTWHMVKPANSDLANACSLEYKDNSLTLKTATEAHQVEFIFPIIHGTRGEDGSIQGLARFYNIPYAGCSVAASAVCMDKVLAKQCFAQKGIPQVPAVHFDKVEFATKPSQVISDIISLGFPVFIKPCNMGSSVGIRRVQAKDELQSAIEHALLFDQYVVAEKGLNVRELEVAIMGSPGNWRMSAIGEISANQSFYSYHAKYLDDKGANLFIQPDLPAGIEQRIYQLTEEAFAAVRGEGFARVDFFLEKETGEVYLNEINTLPGFTPISMFPKLFEHVGVAPSEQLKFIIEQGEQRYRNNSELKLAEDGL